MNLDDGQRKKVAAWISEGLKLSEIQNRLVSELGIGLTYMEVRLLVDDLKLTPKDVEPPKAVELTGKQPDSGPTAPAPGPGPTADAAEIPPEDELPSASVGNVTVKVDQLARPGALVSGNV